MIYDKIIKQIICRKEVFIMAWNPEYTKEFNALMKKWDDEIQEELKKKAPTRGIAAGSKGKTDIINERYRTLLAELKQKYGMA